MDPQRFEDLVSRLEPLAAARPDAFRRRVVLLAAGGYLYVFAILAVLLALDGLMVAWLLSGKGILAAVKLGIPLGALTWVVARSLRVPFPRPEGRPLTRAEAPRLWEVLEETGRAVGAPRLDHLLVTPELNAGVTIRPRLGLLGWSRTWLTLGVPLAAALGPEHFRAVMAHEFAHLWGDHPRTSGWIYRVHATWHRLAATLEESGSVLGGWLFLRFFRAYLPRLDAHWMVLSRVHEIDADRLAGELAGKRTAAEALMLVDAEQALHADYWPRTLSAADHDPTPPRAPYAGLLGESRAGGDPAKAAEAVRQALRCVATPLDTHPPLAERLAALGFPPRGGEPPLPLPPRPERSAAEAYLGQPLLDRLVAEMDAGWLEHNAGGWEERHRWATQARERLAELDVAAAGRALGEEESWERAALLEDLHGPEAAVPALERTVERFPDHASARFTLGRLLLARGDAAGIEHMRRAAEVDPGGAGTVWSHIADFHARHGDPAAARQARLRAAAGAGRAEEMERERSLVSARDRFLPATLGTEEAAALAALLAAEADVARAYVVRKDVAHQPERPCHVLGLVARRPLYRYHSEKRDQELAHRIAASVDPALDLLVVVVNDAAGLERALRKVPGALLHRRGRRPVPRPAAGPA